MAADVQKIGPAQLLTKVRIPTAKKLKPLIPLYALERSTEEMAFEPPVWKNEVYARSKVVRLIFAANTTPCRLRSIGSDAIVVGLSNIGKIANWTK